MPSDNKIIIYAPQQFTAFYSQNYTPNYYFAKSLNTIYRKLKSTSPCVKIVIYKQNFLSLNELQQFKQLKIQFPFLDLYFLPTQKPTFKQSVQLIEADITLINLLDEVKANSTPKKHHQLKFINEYQTKSLRKKESELLHFFYLNRGKVLTKETILSAVWDYKDTVFTRTLECHISSLRSKLKDANGKKSANITTIHGKGYCFSLPVTYV
jgi:DNA-binding winged helix-turn-helix (wHTH) protein